MNDRRYIITVISILFLVLLWALFGILNFGNDEERYPVSVVISESDNDRWDALKQGMMQAAEDYDIDLTIVPTNAFYSISTQLDLIAKELNGGAAGIIAAPVASDGFTKILDEGGNTVSFVFLGTDINPEGKAAFVAPDNTEVGHELAEAIKRQLGDRLEGKKIAVTHLFRKRSASETRYHTICEDLEDTGAEIVLLSSDPPTMQNELEALLTVNGVQGIVALDSIGLEMSIDAILDSGRGGSVPIVGEGYSEKNVYYLDKGVVKELVLPNDFNTGYLCVQSCYFGMTNKLGTNPSHVVDIYHATRENMYDADLEKILFPLAQ